MAYLWSLYFENTAICWLHPCYPMEKICPPVWSLKRMRRVYLQTCRKLHGLLRLKDTLGPALRLRKSACLQLFIALVANAQPETHKNLWRYFFRSFFYKPELYSEDDACARYKSYPPSRVRYWGRREWKLNIRSCFVYFTTKSLSLRTEVFRERFVNDSSGRIEVTRSFSGPEILK